MKKCHYEISCNVEYVELFMQIERCVERRKTKLQISMGQN